METITPKVHGILETALYVRDPSRAAEFYRRLLDCQTLLDSERLVALGIGGQSVLLLFQEGATGESFATDGGVIPGHAGAGPTHFAFSIEASDVVPWRERLSSLGISIESEVTWPGGAQSIYFRDPDQNLAEFITGGFWQLR